MTNEKKRPVDVNEKLGKDLDEVAGGVPIPSHQGMQSAGTFPQNNDTTPDIPSGNDT